jgi:hypothetical protein
MDRNTEPIDEAPKYVKHAIYIIVLVIAAALAIMVVFAALGLASEVMDNLSGSR